MAFTVLNTLALDRFTRKHRDAAKPLADWLDTVKAADWSNLAELRKVYPSADGVNIRVFGGAVVVVTIFNVKGNQYRLIAVIDYALQVCRIADVLTHAEYSAGRWKERL